MRLQGDIAAALPGLQAEAEAMMTELFRIDRPLTVTSDDEGRPVVTLADPPVYLGPGKVRSFRPFESEREVVGTTSVSQRYDTHIPAPTRMAHLVEQGIVEHWNGPVRNGDFLTRITPGRAEEVYRVATEHDITNQTAQRLVADLQTAGIQAEAVEL